MKKASYILSLILLLAPLHGNAENKDLLRADYLYRQLAFHDAIPYYESAAAVPEGQNAQVYARLGDCYRLTKDPAQAAQWYARAVQQNAGVPEDARLHYGEVLMMLQQYEEAARVLKQYQAVKPGDRRAANLIRGCEAAAERLQQIPEGKATLLALNTDGSDFGPALRENDLVFTTDSVLGSGSKKDNWTGNPYYNIYMVSCNDKGQCGNDPEPVGGKMNTKYHDGPAAFTAGGSRMFFTRTTQARQFLSRQPVSDQTGTVRLQIMIAEDYDTAGKKYNKIIPFPYNDKDYSTAHPAVSPDGNMLVFASDMPGGEGETDLYLSRREGNGWTKPVSLGRTVNTEGAEMFPVFIDNTTLSFSSNGHAGLGGLDVYYTRLEAAGTWSEPANAGTPVNSSYDDMSLTLYPGRGSGYFASNRPAAKKGDNIYHFIRQEVYLNLQVMDSASGKGIGQATVLLKSDAGQRRETSGANGQLITRLFPQAMYEVTVSRQGYRTATIRLSAQQPDRERDTIHAVVRLLADLNLSYTAIVLDETSRQPVPEPLVVMTGSGWAKADSAYLETGAVYERALEAGHTYRVYAVKENYYGNEKVIQAKDIKPGGAPVRISDTIFMKRLSIGEVYRVDNIYYDFDKANIREDALPALNRLLELLHQYPAMSIQVNAHTDCRGQDAYNLRLSQARAASVIKYLEKHGINRSRLKSRGFGETEPVHPCRDCNTCTEEQHQMNRRTEFRIIAM